MLNLMFMLHLGTNECELRVQSEQVPEETADEGATTGPAPQSSVPTAAGFVLVMYTSVNLNY